jgi:hypothetical protein
MQRQENTKSKCQVSSRILPKEASIPIKGTKKTTSKMERVVKSVAKFKYGFCVGQEKNTCSKSYKLYEIIYIFRISYEESAVVEKNKFV